MYVYVMQGTLTEPLMEENIDLAQAFLDEPSMEKYLPKPLFATVRSLRWELAQDGFHYSVTAVADRPLTAEETLQLGDEVSGQNSDGLGEGFEQQDFAETENGTWACFDWQTNPCIFSLATS